MARSRVRRGFVFAGALACCIPAAADAQSGAYDRYLGHDGLTSQKGGTRSRDVQLR